MLTLRKLVVVLMALALMPGIWLSLADSAGADDWDDTDRVVRPQEKRGQVDKHSNGTPSAGKIDNAAVQKLADLEDLLSKDQGKEGEIVAQGAELAKTFEANGDYDHLVDCVFLMGEAYYHLADWPNAEKYMGRAAELGYRYFPEEMSTYPLKVMGDAQFEQGKLDAAVSTYRDRVQRLRKHDDDYELPGALFDLASLLINQEKYDDALPLLSEAKSSNEARAKALAAKGDTATPSDVDGTKVDQAEILFHLGIANFRKGDSAEAGRWLKQALAAWKETSPTNQEEFRDRIVAVLDDLVQISEAASDTAAAEDYRSQRDALNH